MTQPSLKYDELVETIPTRFIVFAADDPHFTIVEESKAHADMVSMKREDVVGHPIFDVFPDTSERYVTTGESDVYDSFRRVIKTKQEDRMGGPFRYDIKEPDGTFRERHWRVVHYPLFDEQGAVDRIFQVTFDITDEQRTGTKLKRTEEQLSQALMFGSIGTWLWDIRQNKIIADENLARMFGVPEAEATGGLPLDAFTAAIHPDDRGWVTKAIAKTVKEQSSFEEEYRTIGRDGSMRWVIARGQVESEGGEPAFFPGVLVDITQRKLSEQNSRFLAQASAALSSSLNYKKTLQNIAKMVVPELADWCGVDILDKQTGLVEQVAIIHKNPAKIRWAKELRRKYPVHHDDEGGSAHVIRTGEAEFYPVITPEIITASTDDTEQLDILHEVGLTSAIIVPLKLQQETIGTFSLVLAEHGRHYTPEDFEMAKELANRASLAITNASLYESAQDELTKRRTLEEQLRTANEQLENRVRERTAQLQTTNASLEQSNRELQDFAYVASHDLQEPLRKIQAFGNLLESEYAERLGDGRDYLARMRSAASRMSSLIEDLLQFSRVTTKARAFSRVDLATIAQEVLDDLETRLQDTGGTVSLKELPAIQADPLQMRQLLQNLIGNALKFHKANETPVVTVQAKLTKATKSQDEACVITVQDNGVGFDEKYLDRIFSVFQRLHGRERYEGTGIGLAVCRKIAERHGGAITATSKPGVGSTFIVTLPVRHKRGEEPQ